MPLTFFLSFFLSFFFFFLHQYLEHEEKDQSQSQDPTRPGIGVSAVCSSIARGEKSCLFRFVATVLAILHQPCHYSSSHCCHSSLSIIITIIKLIIPSLVNNTKQLSPWEKFAVREYDLLAEEDPQSEAESDLDF